MKYLLVHMCLALLTVLGIQKSYAQTTSAAAPPWGPSDTIFVAGIIYEGEVLPYKELEMVYVSNLPPEQMAKAVKKYNRLRNAVYVTYPYARTAGHTLNAVNAHLSNMTSRSERKKYIKSREKERQLEGSALQGLGRPLAREGQQQGQEPREGGQEAHQRQGQERAQAPRLIEQEASKKGAVRPLSHFAVRDVSTSIRPVMVGCRVQR
jgi:hypothetical protein